MADADTPVGERTHAGMLDALKKAQEADHDNRERVREARLFTDKRDGQWEPYWWDASSGKPRYTFDQTNPIIDQIAGEMELADFDIAIEPGGGDASGETAEVYDGLVRQIQSMSRAVNVFNDAGRQMVAYGLDGWRVRTKFVNDDAFDQDLAIEQVPNFVDRVWFGQHEEQDASDAMEGWVLTALARNEYKRRYPDGSGQGVTSDIQSMAYFHKPDTIMVGEYLYVKETPRVLVQMSNGAVYEEGPGLDAVRDELAAAGVAEQRRRTRLKRRVFSRKFDNGDWLEPERETVFSWIPLIPVYGNFKVQENKITYWGVVEKLIDSQRVLNYSMSREIEEGALAPRAKYWMTRKQAQGEESTLATLNTNTDPVQFYTPDERTQGPPTQVGGAQINPGLRTISETVRGMLAQVAGYYAATLGDNPNAQSGVAIEQLQDRGSVASVKYFRARERAQEHTARILVDAIPAIYQNGRTITVRAEDGETRQVQLGQAVPDMQTGSIVRLNDLSVGTYDVTCSSGPSFDNRQQKTVAAITEVGQIDPSIIQVGSDILLRNITAPGMDALAERKRRALFEAGAIPVEQWTDEERQIAAQAAQAQAAQGAQPDPATMVAQAELIRAQNEQAKTSVDAQKGAADIQLAQAREQRETFSALAKIRSDQAKAQTDAAKTAGTLEQNAFERVLAIQEQQLAQSQAIMQALESQARILATLRDATGADAVISPTTAQAYEQGAAMLVNSQQEAATR